MAKNLRFPYINSVTISGRLTRDVEVRFTSKGTPVAQMSMAFSRRFQDASGEWREETSFVDVIAWRQAENYGKNLKKGAAIIVEGYLQIRTYQNKENQNVKVVEIVANKIHQLEWTGERPDGAKVDSRYDAYEPAATSPNTNNEPDVTVDDVPF